MLHMCDIKLPVGALPIYFDTIKLSQICVFGVEGDLKQVWNK